MPIPQTTLEVCDKPADDYAYALMIGCIQSGFSFLGPFKAEDEALQAWDEHFERDNPAAIVPLYLVDERAGPGTVHVILGEHGISASGIFPNEERAKVWQPDLINGGEMFGSAPITPPTAFHRALEPHRR
jgi:hypothetical protein